MQTETFYTILYAIVVLYEVLIRTVPTVKSYSILTNIVQAIDKIIPDNIKDSKSQ